MTESTGSNPEGLDPELVDSLVLVRRAQGGELDAYERLFERYYLHVRALVHRKLGEGLRGEVDSEDIVQEAMIQAIQGLESFEVRSRQMLIAWFARIVENRICALDRHGRAQKRDRRRNVPLERIRDSISSGVISLEPAADGLEGIEELMRREEVEEVRRQIDGLSGRQRQVISLRDEEGYSWDEVAREMGLPTPDAARMLHARTRVQLMKAVRSTLKDSSAG